MPGTLVLRKTLSMCLYLQNKEEELGKVKSKMIKITILLSLGFLNTVRSTIFHLYKEERELRRLHKNKSQVKPGDTVTSQT